MTDKKPLAMNRLPEKIEVPKEFIDFYECHVCHRPTTMIALTVKKLEHGEVHVQLKTGLYEEPWLCPDCAEAEGGVN